MKGGVDKLVMIFYVVETGGKLAEIYNLKSEKVIQTGQSQLV